jgi:hypothetical protein
MADERPVEVPMVYERPQIIDYGSITDHTFKTPGGHKGCHVNCHTDSFNELSQNPTT